MLNLIKLELRKNKLSAYLWACLWIFIIGFGFCFLIAFIPQIEALDTGLPIPIDMMIFTQWDTFIMMVSILFAMSFTILSAVMHTKFTVEEYTGKRAILLFSYPQSKSKILFVKCSLVFVFTAVGFMICNTLAISLFIIISNIFGIMPSAFEVSMIPSLLSMSGVCALLSASIGMIAMRIGFWKKSLVATVVAAVILISPFGNIISLLPQYSATIQLISMAVLLIIAVFIFIGLLSKVDKMEAM